IEVLDVVEFRSRPTEQDGAEPTNLGAGAPVAPLLTHVGAHIVRAWRPFLATVGSTQAHLSTSPPVEYVYSALDESRRGRRRRLRTSRPGPARTVISLGSSVTDSPFSSRTVTVSFRICIECT